MPYFRKVPETVAKAWDEIKHATQRPVKPRVPIPTSSDITQLLEALPDRSGISRIDSPKRTHGWYARIYVSKRTISKLFSDRQYGGTVAALDAAIAWRDSIRLAVHQDAETPA